MTETAQPDPQVVAWMRRHLRDNPGASRADLMRGYRNTDSSVSLRELNDAAEAVLYPQPRTVADIPAGQGPASLYVDEYGVVRYRAVSGRSAVIPAGWIARDIDERDALNAALEHLAATLPHVTVGEGA